MSEAADALLRNGIQDAKAALLATQSFDEHWRTFAAACEERQFDIAILYGERLVTLIESAVDLYMSSHRRIAQFEKLVQGPLP